MAEPCRILVMASGNGSNLQALIDAVAAGRIPSARIVQLVVNRGKAFAVQRAEKAGIPHDYFNLISHGFQAKGETDPARLQEARDAYDAALAQKILDLEAQGQQRPQLVVLAGWMQIFGERFLDPLKAAGIRIINLHPSLPRQYEGAHAIERAHADFEAGKITSTGIMVHNVIKQVDQGEAILTREVECRPGDSLADLEARIHSHEHELIVEATAKVVQEIVSGEKQ